MLALCAFLFLPLGLPALPMMITLSSRPQSACAVTNFFTMRMRISPSHGCGLRPYTHVVALVLIETESSCDEGCFGLCRGRTSSDALICCQVLVLILMVDETDPARGLIRTWWRIRNWWWWWSSSEVFYCTVELWRTTFDVLVWQFHHTTTTILLSVVLLLNLLLVGKWSSTLGLLHTLYWVLGCLSPCVVVWKLRLTWPFLWSCGWSILYVSSALLLHDSLHSVFTPVCFSVTRQGALHVLKGIPQLVIPSSQGWGGGGGSELSISTAHGFFVFFLATICLLLFCFCTSSRKEHDQPRLMAMWSPYMCSPLKPFDQTNCACLALQTAAV